MHRTFPNKNLHLHLQAHPGLDEIEREKACSVMDPLRLSYEARLHASQNKRLPLQVVLHALYYDQLKLRSGSGPDEPAIVNVASGDEALVKENEALRSELARMKLYLTDMQRSQGSSTGKSTTVMALPAPPVAGKKTTFFSSVSKKLGRLNPFRQGSKDTSIIEEKAGADLAKPRRRRFSIS